MKRLSFIFTLFFALSAIAAPAGKARVYQRPNGGFVVLDEENSIIGFSDSGVLSSVPEEMSNFLGDNGFKAEFMGILSDAQIEKSVKEVMSDTVGPLLGDISYGQGNPYRFKTPVYKDQHCLAGCVAIAMTQIMAYYQWPKVCHGSVSYRTETLKLNLSENFEGYQPDWDNILHSYKGSYTNAQAEAIAQLVYYAGVAVHMDYDIDGSGTNSDYVGGAFYDNFGYVLGEKLNKSDYVESKWYEIMKAEIDAGRPMYCSSQQLTGGSGHAYVCDGYIPLASGTNPKYACYHFNLGWTGSSDGWYRITQIKFPESDLDLSGNFSVITGIRPNDGSAVNSVSKNVVNTDVYDILGHKVSELVPGQMYISGGKKFIAR